MGTLLVYSIGASAWAPPTSFGVGGGPKRLVLINVLCEMYFACKFLRGCICTVNSELRVYGAPQKLGPLKSLHWAQKLLKSSFPTLNRLQFCEEYLNIKDRK